VNAVNNSDNHLFAPPKNKLAYENHSTRLPAIPSIAFYHSSSSLFADSPGKKIDGEGHRKK
jgi:hypothetical protein